MKNKALSLLLCLAVAISAGCGKAENQISAAVSTTQIETEEHMYTFKSCDKELLKLGSSFIRNVYEDEEAEYHSLFIGQVLSRFGEPDYVSEDNENLFSKAVSATDESGSEIIFEVYYGPSGPTIGADPYGREAEVSAAADRLAEYIMSAEPKDFEYVSIYGDLDITVKMGVKDGKPYYISEIPEDML